MKSPKSPAKTIDQYLQEGASGIGREDLEAYPQTRACLQSKFEELEAMGQGKLAAQGRVLMRAVDAGLAGEHPAITPKVWYECLFALQYLLKGYDHIPDSVPEIGLEDDAFIMRTVVERHREMLLTLE
ncbi:MAG: hypothetical protein HC904_02275 [Blastochloris sp.]|nr:hypothetical protein [Blastochloris sp.]